MYYSNISHASRVIWKNLTKAAHLPSWWKTPVGWGGVFIRVIEWATSHNNSQRNRWSWYFPVQIILIWLDKSEFFCWRHTSATHNAASDGQQNLVYPMALLVPFRLCTLASAPFVASGTGQGARTFRLNSAISLRAGYRGSLSFLTIIKTNHNAGCAGAESIHKTVSAYAFEAF